RNARSRRELGDLHAHLLTSIVALSIMDSVAIHSSEDAMKPTIGRMTHEHHGELGVFHIGMQINRWWRPDLWLPAFLAMPPMLRELSVDDESGLLGYELLLGRGGPYV